jgi:hypothetical protein
MTEHEAILLLASYNLWRLGAEIEMKEPKEITEAINGFGLCVRFLPTRMFKVSTNVKGKK